MRAGSLDRRVTLLRRSQAVDAYGQPVAAVTEIATVWANWKPLTGKQLFAAKQAVANAVAEVRIRYRDDLSPLDAIRYDGTEYDVSSVQEIGRREGLTILASAQVEHD